MVRLSGYLICKNQKEFDVVNEIIGEHIRNTLDEPGCIKFSVKPTDKALIWQVEELFVDQLAFEEHQNRVAKSDWGQKTRSILRDYKVTTI